MIFFDLNEGVAAELSETVLLPALDGKVKVS